MVNKRKIIINDPKFQYKFSLIICSVVFLGSLIFPTTIYELFEQMKAVQPGNAEHYESSKYTLLTILFSIELAFIGLVFIASLLMSHKIAGPMVKLKNYLSDVRAGEANYPLQFRDGDYFQDITEHVNQTVTHLQSQFEDDLDYIEEVVAYIDNISLVVPNDKKPVLNEITQKLTAIINRNKIR